MWLEAQECDYLSITDQKLQATTESITKECGWLEKSNGDLRKKTCELKASQKILSNTLKEIDALEAKFSLILEGVSLKEKERTASDAAFEAYCLRMDSTLLEAALQEIQGKFNLYESKLDALQMESESKKIKFTGEIASSKQNHEILMINHEKLTKRNSRRLFKSLNLSLKTSKYEKQQRAEEVSCLKNQFQKVELLQDEVFALERSPCSEKSEKRRLEASFQILSGDYEELKAKRISYVEKISKMKNFGFLCFLENLGSLVYMLL
ncbi:hypothetical protein UlMin_026058 [Ulmus minor]